MKHGGTSSDLSLSDAVSVSVIRNIAVFPVKLRVLPQFIFNSRDPIVMGVSVEAGVLKQGTPLCVPSKGVRRIGKTACFS